HAQQPGRTSVAIHYGGRSNYAQGVIRFEDPAGPSQFHTWAVEIEPGEGNRVCVTFYLDDKPVPLHRPENTNTLCFEDVDGAFARHPGENLFDIAVNL